MSDVLIVCGGFVFLWVYSAFMYWMGQRAGWRAAEVRAEMSSPSRLDQEGTP